MLSSTTCPDTITKSRPHTIKFRNAGKSFLQTLFFFLLITQMCVAQWYQQTSGTTQSLGSIFFIDSLSGWAVGAEGEIIISTTDGGSNWNLQFSGTLEYLSSVFFVSKTEGWAAGGNFDPLLGMVYYTSDGGNQWILQTDTIPIPLSSIFFISSEIGWAVGHDQILKTTDGGNNWFSQAVEVSEYTAVFFVNENIGWAVGGDPFNRFSKILKTTDGGNSWLPQIANTNNYLRAVHFVSETTGWVTGNGGVIFKTTDGGTAWIEQTSGTTDGLYSIAFASNDTGFIVGGGEGLILCTFNGGANWTPQNSGTTEWLGSICLSEGKNAWVSGNSGTILHTTNGGVTFVDGEQIDQVPTEYFLSQNYPNPFNPTTTIGFGIPEKTNVRLSVLNILGEEINILLNEEKEAGYHSIDFNASDLPSGVYFYQLKVYPANGGSGNPESSSGQVFIDTKKMMMLK